MLGQPSSSSDDFVIETQGLTKPYRDLVAVNRLTLRVRRGEVYGFLGPNVSALGVPTATLGDNGQGSFFGPFVGASQAILVMSRTPWASWLLPPCCSAVGTSHERRA